MSSFRRAVITLMIAVCAVPLPLLADDVLVSGIKQDQKYILEHVNGQWQFRPAVMAVPAANPTKPPVTGTVAVAKRLTDAQAENEYKVTLAAVYQYACDHAKDGKWSLQKAMEETAKVGRQIVAKAPAWKAWTDGIADHFDALRQRGQFGAAAFCDVSSGVKASLAGQALEKEALDDILLKLLPIILQLLAGGEFDPAAIVDLIIEIIKTLRGG